MITEVMKKDALSVAVATDYYYLCREKSLEKINIKSGEIENKISYGVETYADIFLSKDQKHLIAYSYKYGFVDLLDVDTLAKKYRYRKKRGYGDRDDVYYDYDKGILYSLYTKFDSQKGFITYLTQIIPEQKELLIQKMENFVGHNVYYNYLEQKMNISGVHFLNDSFLDEEKEPRKVNISIGAKGITHFEDFDKSDYDLCNVNMTDDGSIFFIKRIVKKVSPVSQRVFYTLCENSEEHELISNMQFIGFIPGKKCVVTINSETLQVFHLDSKTFIEESKIDIKKDTYIHNVSTVGLNHFSIWDGDFLYVFEISD